MRALKWPVWVTVVFMSMLLTGPKAHGRPDYSKAFRATYEKEFAGKTEVFKCKLCHPKEKFISRNKYSDAVAESLKVKNVKDIDAIQAALRETEGKPSAIEGVTFGDLSLRQVNCRILSKITKRGKNRLTGRPLPGRVLRGIA